MVNCSAENDATLLDRLRLQLVPGIGPRVLQLLLEHVGEATEILAKHDEDYMPKEVVDALKAQGVYQEPEAEYNGHAPDSGS